MVTHDPFAAPPPDARAIAITMVTAILSGDEPTQAHAEKHWLAGTGEQRAAIVHACLNLFRAVAMALRTDAGMALIEGRFIDDAADKDPNGPDRHLAAAIIASHLQTARSLPTDHTSATFHNIGVTSFNDALDAAIGAGRATQAFQRAFALWAQLLPEANGDAGAALLADVAAQLWPDDEERT